MGVETWCSSLLVGGSAGSTGCSRLSASAVCASLPLAVWLWPLPACLCLSRPLARLTSVSTVCAERRLTAGRRSERPKRATRSAPVSAPIRLSESVCMCAGCVWFLIIYGCLWRDVQYTRRAQAPKNQLEPFVDARRLRRRKHAMRMHATRTFLLRVATRPVKCGTNHFLQRARYSMYSAALLARVRA